MQRVESRSSVASEFTPFVPASAYGYDTDVQYTYITAHASPLRSFALKLITSPAFSVALIAVIVLNAILMATTTTKRLNISYGWYIQVADFIFQAIYTFEILLKLFALQRIIITNMWHMFDIILVVLGFLEWVKYLGNVTIGDIPVVDFLQFFRVFRVISALRLLRSITFFKKLQLIVSSLLRSLPAMGALGFLLFLVMYISAVVTRALYGSYWPLKFGSIGNAMLSCFQLLTLDDAFNFYDEIHGYDESIAVFLFLYVVIATFVVCQMLIAIILNNLEEAQKQYNDLINDKRKRQKQLGNAKVIEKRLETLPPDSIVPPSLPLSNSPRPPAANPDATSPLEHHVNRQDDVNANEASSSNLPNDPNASNINNEINTDISAIPKDNPVNNINVNNSNNKNINLAQKRVMEEYTRAFTQSTDREKQLTLQYFMDLASIENELNVYLNQTEILDRLVTKLREQE